MYISDSASWQFGYVPPPKTIDCDIYAKNSTTTIWKVYIRSHPPYWDLPIIIMPKGPSFAKHKL